MQSLFGLDDLATILANRGIDLSALGAAYLVLLATVLLTVAGFAAVRAYLVISPNRSARDYGVYSSVVLGVLLIATVLENELLPRNLPALQYAAVPQLLLLLALHLWIVRRQEPWLITLGGASISSSMIIVAVAGAATGLVRMGLWLALLLLGGLLGFLWAKSVSTKRGFLTANSIYLTSKETLDAVVAPQRPWLGLPQWLALVAASAGLAVANALLRGRNLEQIPAVDVALESSLLLIATALICAVPAAIYWFTRKTWMPELTRFVWLVWMIVSFSLTYGNYLTFRAI